MKKNILPGVFIELVSLGDNMMTVKITLVRGAVVPEHTHPHEQTSFINQGCLRYNIAGQECTLRAGDGTVIRPNVPHSCVALEDTVDINTFYPPREDYMKILLKEEK
ncbi:MAG: cupin domain-containing protein [Clostridiales bacterium]|jgi:quercetin dioxygenase-like cupin family protein|nr:cupin domain-containing protein [Clostridiales bacterium]